MSVFPLFINGEFVTTTATKKISSPSTGEVITEVSIASASEVDAAISAARAAFDRGPWGSLPAEKRKTYLLNIAQGILDNAAELADLETRNTGKPIKESTFMDIPSAARTFEYIAHNFENFLKDASPKIEAEASCRLLREPMGVAALIVPWNYPLLIACWKLASALAAGNSVILKPSSLTPLTTLVLGRIIHAADLPKGAVNIINGNGDDIGRQICSDARVDLISFTGSNEVGGKIVGFTAGYPKKMIMELGGKSASIVMADADLDVATNCCLCSIFLNQGQMCTAMSRILVEDKIYEQFVESFVAKAKKIKLGRGEDFQTQMGPLISQAQRDKVMGFVEHAVKEGAKVLCGGKIPGTPGLENGFFFEPTLIGEVTPEMKICQEEVFGPVACLGSFSNEEDAIRQANNTPYALAANIWTSNQLLAQKMAEKINAGTVWINTYGMFYPEIPYGGFKQSGFGKELGREGLLEHTRLKNIIIDQSKDGKPLVNYWYGF